jgi:hypothetical protein
MQQAGQRRRKESRASKVYQESSSHQKKSLRVRKQSPEEKHIKCEYKEREGARFGAFVVLIAAFIRLISFLSF